MGFREGTGTAEALVPSDGALTARGSRRRAAAALVLLGDLIYVVVALSIQDPVRYATPLLLMFPSFVAAWFLPRPALIASMGATSLACLVALEHSHLGPAAIVIQLVLTAGVLNAAALGIYLLRRRVERLLAATHALSTLDPLTGLANRRSLVAQAPRLWRQARREGTRVAAMVLDLDHFKQLNDAHGHAAGDAVLCEVGRALSSTVRPTDVLARTGGEELLVLGLVGDTVEAMRLAERLRLAVAGSRTPEGHTVTASVGLALARPVDGEDAVEGLWRLVDRADAAMYQAKRLGRDQVVTARAPRGTRPWPHGVPNPYRRRREAPAGPPS